MRLQGNPSVYQSCFQEYLRAIRENMKKWEYRADVHLLKEKLTVSVVRRLSRAVSINCYIT